MHPLVIFCPVPLKPCWHSHEYPLRVVGAAVQVAFSWHPGLAQVPATRNIKRISGLILR